MKLTLMKLKGIRQFSPRNKKKSVHYNTGEVKNAETIYNRRKQNLVAMFKSGTQTTTAFAQANGINPLTFRIWIV